MLKKGRRRENKNKQQQQKQSQTKFVGQLDIFFFPPLSGSFSHISFTFLGLRISRLKNTLAVISALLLSKAGPWNRYPWTCINSETCFMQKSDFLFISPVTSKNDGVFLWHRGLGIQLCHCSSQGHCCGTDSLAQEPPPAVGVAKKDKIEMKK